VTFQPSQDKNGQYPAIAKEWPTHMACCREIKKITLLPLRTIDRALQGSGRHIEVH
jgi:hypothetical protein